MENRNMPASGYEGNDYHMEGLTKLEYAAIEAMQGILAAQAHNLSQGFGVREVSMKHAVEQANALFDELEKNNG